MKKLPLRFALILLVALAVVFAIHISILSVLDKPLWADLIVLSYVLNYALALGIFLLLFYLKEKVSNAIGFLFMGGSLLKFIVFFIVFYPTYKGDGDVGQTEFAAFFVPYLISLVLETFFASKMLREMEQKAD